MHSQSIKQVISTLRTDLEDGLPTDEAEHRLLSYGLNQIEQTKDTSIILLILRQFKSPIVFLLVFATTLSFAYSKWGDGIAVLIVLLINACIGFFMEFQAERSMNALRRLSKSFAKVIRNGSLYEISTTAIVPGDLLYVEAGDIIPADAGICTAFQLQVDAMTGESIPREKTENELPLHTTLAERTNMLFKGTFVTRGNAKALVVATGLETELGKIALLVQTSKDSVAAIPEGLTIVATLALAHGMMKMARRNVIVKKLASVETLGGTTVICTDQHIDTSRLREEYPKISEEPFKSETKIMATLHEGPDNNVLFAKGASESIIQLCSHYQDGTIRKEFSKILKDRWLRISEDEASEGLKVIAFAFKPEIEDRTALDLSNLTFFGDCQSHRSSAKRRFRSNSSALALGFSAGSETIMNRPPRDPDKPVLSRQWMSVIVYAIIIALSTFSTSLFTLAHTQSQDDVQKASTVLFYTLILAQLLYVFSVGDHRQAFFKTDIFKSGYVWSGVSTSVLLAIAAFFIQPVRQVLQIGELEVRSVVIILGCGFQSFSLFRS